MQLKRIVPALLLFVFEFSFAQNPGHISLQTAKFITGDDRMWKEPDFIDTQIG